MWGVLGGKIHDKLEEITNGEAEPDELKGMVDKELEYLDILELDFPKDFSGGDSIRNNWKANMQHFCNNFTPLKGKYCTEELVILKVDDEHYLQGYVDLVKLNDDGTIAILDWKTSSLYTGPELGHAAHQLVIYGLAKEQEGETVRQLAWIFMKYVNVEFMGKKRANSKEKSQLCKTIERRKLAQELKPYVEDDLYTAGYNEIDTQILIDEMLKNNSLDGLPDEVKAGYKIKPCVQTTEFDDKAKQKTWDYVRNMINEFERRTDRESDWEPREFYSLTKKGFKREDTFFCNALCDFGNTCKYIQMFNAEKAAEKEEESDKYEDLF